MKEQCMICGSVVEDVSGICPVCGAVLGRSTQVEVPNPQMNYQGGNPGMNPQMGYPNGNPGMNPQMGYPNGNPMMNQQMNYQNPYNTTTAAPKGKLFSILALVSAVLCLLTVCFPVVSILFGIAAIVLGIIALVKKQIKVMPIIGFVVGGIGLLFAAVMLFTNLMLQMQINTNIMGLVNQIMVAQRTGPQNMDNLNFTVKQSTGEYQYTFFGDGTYIVMPADVDYEDAYFLSGTYDTYNYADSEVQDRIQYELIYAMGEGYEVKDLTAVRFTPNRCVDSHGDPMDLPTSMRQMVFVFPDGYTKGDTFYYMEKMARFDDYKMIPVENSYDLDELLDYLREIDW